MKYFDVVNNSIAIFGSTVITYLILAETGVNIQPLAAVTGVILAGVIIFTADFLLYRMRSRIQVDERMKTITDKSARNGLLTMYLGLFIVIALLDTLEPIALLAVVSASFAAVVASLCFYYVRTS